MTIVSQGRLGSGRNSPPRTHVRTLLHFLDPSEGRNVKAAVRTGQWSRQLFLGSEISTVIEMTSFFIDVDGLPDDVGGDFQLLFLFLSYGYLLYLGSDLISSGSELLLLVPSLADVVGSVVLPVLGAVPDGAIVLFSGLGDGAQEQLNVGIGALAGSTIMLLTLPWGIAVLAGRVNLSEDGTPNYRGRPRLSPTAGFWDGGVGVAGRSVEQAGIWMAVSCLPFFIIQGTAFATNNNSKAERVPAIVATIIAAALFFSYLRHCMTASAEDAEGDTGVTDKLQEKVLEKLRRAIKAGNVTLRGALVLETGDANQSFLQGPSGAPVMANGSKATAEPLLQGDPQAGLELSPADMKKLEGIAKPVFKSIDTDGSGAIDKRELTVGLKELGERVTAAQADALLARFDWDHSGTLDEPQFYTALAYYVSSSANQNRGTDPEAGNEANGEEEDGDEDEPEMPEDLVALSADEQQVQIKRRAALQMGAGTLLVLIFSDPMVDIFAEIGNRIGISAFYVAFVLAPLASNAAELIAAKNYASKKTAASCTISFSTLVGAGIMNNTFCLAIFLGVVAARGLEWEYAAESISIVFIEFVFAFYFARLQVMTVSHAIAVFLCYPLALGLVAGLENGAGLD